MLLLISENQRSFLFWSSNYTIFYSVETSRNLFSSSFDMVRIILDSFLAIQYGTMFRFIINHIGKKPWVLTEKWYFSIIRSAYSSRLVIMSRINKEIKCMKKKEDICNVICMHGFTHIHIYICIYVETYICTYRFIFIYLKVITL